MSELKTIELTQALDRMQVGQNMNLSIKFVTECVRENIPSLMYHTIRNEDILEFLDKISMIHDVYCSVIDMGPYERHFVRFKKLARSY